MTHAYLRNTSGVQSRYYDYLASGQWRIPFCTDCKKAIFYPRQICPHCGHDVFRWAEPAGTGTIYSKSVVQRPEKHGGAYCIVLVDLDDGFRMMSRIHHSVPPNQVSIGMRVKSLLGRIDGSEQTQILFEPINGN